MPRLMFSDEHWPKLRVIMLKERIYDNPDLRRVVEGIFYRLRVGCPWQDLPSDFGDWNSVYKRLNDWSSKGKRLRILQALVDEPDLEWVFIMEIVECNTDIFVTG